MKLKLPRKDDVAIDMAPMIDMVFLLLIFFMVASVVVTDKVKIALPEAQSAKVPEDTKNRMMLSVDANNQIYVNTNPVTIKELKKIVSDELDINPGLRILIRADKDVEYKTNKDIIIACAEVGASDLIYATFEE
ncbi:MAG: biopolymer transporter ExbD [Verrucomicrobia bacterium]|nr:biopolymer transporter ExbD [Verrucomicrobiota bacterium]